MEKKEEIKVKHEKNIIQEEMFRRRMQEELKIQEMRLQMKSKEYEKRDKTKETETLMSTNTRKIKIYSVKILDINCEFGFETELNHLQKEVLLELPNPKYRELQNTYIHLKDLQINDHDPKGELPVYVILGISDYTKIKTQEQLTVGLPGEIIAEWTKFGWVITSPGQETGITNMLFSKTSLHDYEKLCSLDCLGIEE